MRLPTVLLLHGNNRSRKDCLPQAEFLLEEGFSVLLISQRAHGDSTGEINDIGYSARHDVIAAVKYLEEKRPNRPIAIWGISLGSASALFAAPQVGTQVKGYILESPYRDLKTAVNHRMNLFLPPVLNTAAFKGLMFVAPMMLPHYEEIAPINAAKLVPRDVRVLVLAGEKDDRTPVCDVQEITDQLGSRAKLCTMPGAGHCKLLTTDRKTYRNWTTQFLKELVSEPR